VLIQVENFHDHVVETFKVLWQKVKGKIQSLVVTKFGRFCYFAPNNHVQKCYGRNKVMNI